MGQALVLKEIRNHLLSFRFLAVFALLLAIVPATVLILTNDTVRRQDEYSRRQADVESYLAHYAHFNRIGNIIAPSQPPLPMQALILGLSVRPALELFDNDPLPVMFPLIDLTFVLGILMSLAALIFTYDAVSGEKEDGTLKLMLANGVPRAKILLSKIVGATATLALPFLVSLAIGLILLVAHPRIALKASDWGSLALILAGGMVYVGLFTGLGTLVSTRHASSASSILTCLFVWVVLILVVPNLSPYVASLIKPAPSIVEVNRTIARITDTERDDLGRQLSRERTDAVLKANPVLQNVRRMSDEEIKAEIGRDPEFARAYDLYRRAAAGAWDEANAIQGAKAESLQDDLETREKAQMRLSVRLSMISPLASMTYFSADLSHCGTRNLEYFQSLAGAFWNAFRIYQRGKIEEMRRTDPTVNTYDSIVDVRDMPRFVYKEEQLAGRVKAAAGPFVLLFVMALAVFTAAALSFNRTDPR